MQLLKNLGVFVISELFRKNEKKIEIDFNIDY